MKQYVIDELRSTDYETLKKYFDDTFGPADMGGIYWIPLETDQLTETQVAHSDCQPFFAAVDLKAGQLTCELLIRTHNRMRCSCIEYATDSQRNRLMQVIDGIFDKLEIIT
jgi:hypothetical protein